MTSASFPKTLIFPKQFMPFQQRMHQIKAYNYFTLSTDMIKTEKKEEKCNILI